MSELSIEKRVFDLLSPVVVEEGVFLYDVEWTHDMGRKILRVYIDKEGEPINLDDCTRVSHAVEDLLEVKGQIESAYDLEVSSPGLNRPLRNKGHFEKVLGKVVKIKTQKPIEGRQNYKGVALEVNDETVLVKIDGKDYSVPLKEIKKAHLEFFETNK